MRTCAIAVALALAALTLPACQGRHQRPACPTGQICFLLGNGAEPGSLDPAKIDGVWEGNIVGELIEGLTDVDANGRPVPGIAKSWSVSPDGLTWTFQLRDAQWSDGVAVTADDFVFGIRRLMDPKTAANSAFIDYAIVNGKEVNSGRLPLTALGVSAPDPHTVVIRLVHPWPILPLFASGRTFWPAPRHAVERWGDAWTRPGRYVGDGPYSLVSWKLGDRVVVARNPRFWDAAHVCIDQIAFYPTNDAVSAERRVRAGEIDAMENVQSNRLAFLRRTGMSAYLRVAPQWGLTYLTFNLRGAPALRDVRVRQALSMAIDRDFITRKLLRGGQTPAYSYVPHTDDYPGGPRVYWAGWSFERRQAEARRLLTAAGYGPGEPLKLVITHRNSPDPILFLPSIQADWREVGVDVQLRQNETQVAYETYQTGDYDVGDAGWAGADAMTYLELERSDTGPLNYGQYRNPAFDETLDAANREPDIGRRAALMARAEQILLDDAPLAPIFFLSSRDLVNPNITGWLDNPTDAHQVRWMCVRRPVSTSEAPPG
ncbi:MAG: peptide ABC transporter substrate-binding protein [Caulobacterales bacterium]